MLVLKVKICWTKNLLKNYTKQYIENLKNEKKHSVFIDNSWGADLANMQLISNEFQFQGCWYL